ncbi:MAG: PhzF family phenazine biosynthesis protein [Bdellovibrionota bacterium]|nr:MAG: PhzF family phenazine biosynthesis protein [Bdellovibrionota bacterium]
MRLPIFQVDAFTNELFRGNPAAVCPLEEWLPDQLMQAIAMENNLSETAFFLGKEGLYEIRWFTPISEVDLCGHATLAAAFVIFTFKEPHRMMLRFHSKSGALEVSNNGDTIALDFPAAFGEQRPAPPLISQALGVPPIEYYFGDSHLVLLESEKVVASLTPNLELIARLPGMGLVVTARGEQCDFVSRYFAPQIGINEDPVTGATHCYLVPYWAKRLGKSALYAKQLSARGGELFCEDRGERVSIAGHAVMYLQGEITISS